MENQHENCLNESDDNHGLTTNDKLNGHNKYNHHHHRTMNNNNHDINKNGITENNGKIRMNGNNSSSNGDARRDSITNVWSPLLQTDITTTILPHSDSAMSFSSTPPPLSPPTVTTPMINKKENNGKLNNNNNNNGAAIYSVCNTNNNDDEWKETEDIGNRRNKLSNNNGSSILLNDKNGIGLDKLLDENSVNKKLNYQHNNNNNKTNLYNDDNSYGENATDDSNLSDKKDKNNVGANCGIFGCKPKWAKNFASTHMFMVVFLLAWILQGMFLTYFVSVITTIEKLFQIKSKTTGMILSVSEVGQISTALLMTYYAGRGHRPRWIAWGMMLFSISAFGCALPHFLFSEQLMQSSMFTANTPPAIVAAKGDIAGIAPKTERFYDDSPINMNLTTSSMNFLYPDNMNLCLVSNNNITTYETDECEEDIKIEQASHSKITVIVLCILFISLLGAGVGQTAVSTLGIPYIDDNVGSLQAPIYMAITIGVRILGPATGFIVGSFCTRIYVDLTQPEFNVNDPRWISAWWLGPVGIGTLMFLASIAMFTFPKQLHGAKSSSTTSDQDDLKQCPDEEKPKLKDFPKTVQRQLSNDILMFRTASSVFHLLPIAGFYTFLPKYLETQFRLSAADANLMAAFTGILVMGVGIVVSGIAILKIRPSAISVAAWIAFTALVYSCGMAILMFIGCNMDDFAGLTRSTDRHMPTIFEPTCNMTCSCDLKQFSPVCGIDNKIYFSSCHAGCSAVELKDGKPIYSNCECIPDFANDETSKTYEAYGGYCDSKCKNFIYFICLFAFCVFMHSTSEVGSMLLIMRCTDPKDKAMAMGVIHSAIGLFGNVPCSIIYGAVVDSACLVWKTVCGKVGACSLYDIDSFRHYFLGITSSIMFIAFLMDIVVWKKAHRIHIAPKDSSTNKPYMPDTSV